MTALRITPSPLKMVLFAALMLVLGGGYLTYASLRNAELNRIDARGQAEFERVLARYERTPTYGRIQVRQRVATIFLLPVVAAHWPALPPQIGRPAPARTLAGYYGPLWHEVYTRVHGLAPPGQATSAWTKTPDGRTIDYGYVAGNGT